MRVHFRASIFLVFFALAPCLATAAGGVLGDYTITSGSLMFKRTTATTPTLALKPATISVVSTITLPNASGIVAVSASSPLAEDAAGALTIQDAAADGATKGAASFTATDFDSAAGQIALDFTNAQKATGSLPGFLAAADWTTFTGKQAGDATLTALAAHNTNGLLTQTAPDTFSGRTLTGDTEIVVSNGDGVAGSPTLSIASTLARDTELPVGANPTATLTAALQNGVATTFMRSDAAPKLPQALDSTASPQFANVVITNGGAIKPSADSTTALQIAQTGGTPFIQIDTVNKRTGIGAVHTPINGGASALSVRSGTSTAPILDISSTIPSFGANTITGKLALATNWLTGGIYYYYPQAEIHGINVTAGTSSSGAMTLNTRQGGTITTGIYIDEVGRVAIDGGATVPAESLDVVTGNARIKAGTLQVGNAAAVAYNRAGTASATYATGATDWSIDGMVETPVLHVKTTANFEGNIAGRLKFNTAVIRQVIPAKVVTDNVATGVFTITVPVTDNGFYKCKVSAGIVEYVSPTPSIAASKSFEAHFSSGNSDASVAATTAVSEISETASASQNSANADIGTVTMTVTGAGAVQTVLFLVDVTGTDATNPTVICNIELIWNGYATEPVIAAL